MKAGDFAISTMSEEQLAALLSKLKEDAGLREKFKRAADLGGAVAMAKEAGFDVSQKDWLGFQAKQTIELNDEELDHVAGGKCTASNVKLSAPDACPAPGA